MAVAASPQIGMASTQLWKFLGVKKGEPFTPFPAQAEALTKIRVPWPGRRKDGTPYPRIFGVNCGRRFSKTTLGEKFVWQGVIQEDDFFGPPTVRVTADTEEHGRKVWDRFLFHLYNTELQTLMENHSRERELVTFKNGATAQLLSANNPNNMAGDGVTLWVIDEAQYFSNEAYVNLLPSVAERNGVIIMLGVAQGEGPFREVCYKGDHPKENPEFLRLTYPTWANPYVPKEYIEFARRNHTPTDFKNLYAAQWDTDGGKVFRNVRGAIHERKISQHPLGFALVEDFKPGHQYYGGLDLAKLQDWTVFTIWDRMGDLVAWDRFNLVDWRLQEARIKQLHDWYGRPPTAVDATGVGDAVYENLARAGLNVVEKKITGNAVKKALVDEFAIRIAKKEARYPEIPVFLTELERFEAKASKAERSSLVIYSAPSGQTDDFVMSGALAFSIIPRRAVATLPQADEVRQEALWDLI